MEYIDGKSIDKFDPSLDGKEWEDIFEEVISAFEYLEKNNILHRDIRPANIMIDKNNNVKIIDFGFGKQFNGSYRSENSILLNWPATEMPNEVQLNQDYDKQTEIYFVGTIFKHLLKESICDFRYQHILEKMTKINPSQRYLSFMEIASNISAGVLSEINFSEEQKKIYSNFADALEEHIVQYFDKYSPINNMSVTLSKLAELIRNSALEKYIQNNNQLIKCFIDGGFTYESIAEIEVQNVIDFYELVTSISPIKQKILFDNIYTRLAKIKVVLQIDDELPF